MGFVNVEVRIANPFDTTKAAPLVMLADTGALYSIAPATLLAELGIEASHTEEFQVADGRVIERRLGMAHLTVDHRQALTYVIFGEPGDSILLGVVTLEELGYVINPSTGTLERIQFRLGRVGVPRAGSCPTTTPGM
jgi:predicted aspartyl protease